MIRFMIALGIVSMSFSASAFPDEDYISYGCHGGFTGGGASTAILRSGGIYRSQRTTYQSELVETYIGEDSKAARRLFLASERVDFELAPAPEPKPFDCVIAKRIGGHTYGISLDRKDPPAAANALADLFVELLSMSGTRVQ
jgi:hypothetical protein